MRFRITCPCKHKPFFMFLFFLSLRGAKPLSTSSVFSGFPPSHSKAMSANLLVEGNQVLIIMNDFFFLQRTFLTKLGLLILHCAISAENKFHMEVSQEVEMSQGILLAMFLSIFSWNLVHTHFVFFCSTGWYKVSSEREDIHIYWKMVS